MESTATPSCVSCGAPQPGEYCSACGERRLSQSDRRLSAFLARAVLEVSDLDSRLLRTLRALLFKPGELTRAFIAGQRVGCLPPVQLFLLINLVYFVVQPFTAFNGYNTTLESHLGQQIYSNWLPVQAWIDAAASRLAVDADTFRIVFDSQSELLAPTLLLFIVPLFALFVALLMAGRRALPIDHCVFALHVVAFQLVVMHMFVALVWPPIVDLLLRVLYSIAGADAGWVVPVMSLISEVGLTLAVVGPYLYTAFRRVYAVTRARDPLSDSWLRFNDGGNDDLPHAFANHYVSNGIATVAYPRVDEQRLVRLQCQHRIEPCCR
ncbi:MAG: DUF3667 domain-containing protein [Pseudomonadota bacterium]